MDTDQEDAMRTHLEAALDDCRGEARYHVRAALQYLAVDATAPDHEGDQPGRRIETD
jgi:hypothetical protein